MKSMVHQRGRERKNNLNNLKPIKGRLYGKKKLELNEVVSDWVDDGSAVDVVYLDFKKRTTKSR